MTPSAPLRLEGGRWQDKDGTHGSALSIALRRQEATRRIEAATGTLLGAHGLTPSPYTGLSKDKDIAPVATLEAIAGDLEALVAAVDTATVDATEQAAEQAAETKPAVPTKKAKS